ncbi:sigma-E factor regulatory protein RseB domain-containing protein [Cryptosporangium aurantiacum]|uniref:Sigma-E factor negative regulatory protein RseB n=1 Tax=Cryptosporangium aurantiacum TaxID=134849 RepID=A0A1M7QQ14_9ACTN|nr:sigma-E factor regulatory protein RseB domain-containing protein [Cryptosporangium aurantiacum]SHN33533.1 sigma-E factor negative regulatory protein RseB [Cryptosporangium aurantiacum]
MKLVDPRAGLLRAARRLVLVVGAGALGAVVCSTGVYLFVPAPVETTGAGQSGGGSSLRSAPALTVGSRTLGAGERRALDLLRRAARAQAETGYQGTKLFRSWSRWGQVTTTAFVRNVPGHGVTVVATDGSGRSGAGRPTGQLVAVDGTLDLSDATLATLTQAYRVEVRGAERMLERPVTRIDVLRLSGTIVGRLWVDDETGLAIQRELLDTASRVIRRSTFTGLTVLPTTAVTPAPSEVPASDAPSEAVGACDDGLSDEELAELTAEGWDLPGKRLAGLTQVCARTVGTGADLSVQLSYSDGLFALSLFAQRGRLDESAVPAGFSRRQVGDTEVYLRCGLYREVSWAGSGMVYTLITDVPDATVTTVVESLPTVSADTGVLARMSKGIRRVGSWVDPFH